MNRFKQYFIIRVLRYSIILSGFFVAVSSFTETATAQTSLHAEEKEKLAEFRVDTVANEIYLVVPVNVRHGFVEPNITIVEGDESLLVVDAGFLPSSARQIISKLQQLTEKPVRYLLNTHWHGDHHHGNTAWKEAYPDLKIVAHSEGRREIVELGITDIDGFIENYYPDGINNLREEIKDTVTISEAELREKKQRLRLLEQTLAEIKDLEAVVPERTFEDSLTLDLGNRDVKLLYIGLGNTSGDALAYIPDQRILVTGDLVVHPRPYITSDHYEDWAETLERVSEIPAERIIPGHGAIQDDFEYINSLIALLRTVEGMVKSGYGDDIDLEDLQKRITVEVVEAELESRYGIEPGYFGMSDPWIEYFVSRAYEQQGSK